MLTPLCNRADGTGPYQLPADGYYPLCPLGEHPASHAGRRVVQVLDAQALQAIANRVAADLAANPAGLLVDYDHASLDLDKSTRAAGWITAVENRADGLYAQIRWSAPGQADIEGGAFRYLSPVFDGQSLQDLGSGRLRPTRLLNAGLTNDPNLKTLPPLTNRHQAQEPQTMTPAILKALGLPEDATPEQAAEKAAALANRATKAETDLAALKAERLAAQVDADLEQHKDVIANRDAMKAALLADREGTLKVLASLKPAAAPAIPNRRTATVPASDPAGASDLAGEAKAAAIRNRAAQIQRDQHVTFQTAWNLAQQELA